MAQKKYWGKYENGTAATPRGPKGFVESSAALISNQATGTGKTVCIMRENEATGFCYVDGARVKRKKS